MKVERLKEKITELENQINTLHQERDAQKLHVKILFYYYYL